MSTVFYGFRATDYKHLFEQVYLLKELVKTHKGIGYPEGIEIQVFETKTGLIFRVLEDGYALKNLMWEDYKQFSPINYDDRTDMTPEDEKNHDIVNEIDELIMDNKSVVIIIVESTLQK